MPSEKLNIFEVNETCKTEAAVLGSNDLKRFLDISRAKLGFTTWDVANNSLRALEAYTMFRKFGGIFSNVEGRAVETLERLNGMLLDKICREGVNIEFPGQYLGFFERNARTFMARGFTPIIVDEEENEFGLPIYPSDEKDERNLIKLAWKIKLVALPDGIKYGNIAHPKTPEEILADTDGKGLGFEAAKEASHASFATVRYKRNEGGRIDGGTLAWSEIVTLPRGTIESELLEQNRQYGSALFEGIGVEYDDNGNILIFRLDDHAERMSKGGQFFDMPPIPLETYREIVIKTVLANKKYIPACGKGRLYIRPDWFDKGPKLHVGSSDLQALTVTGIAIGSVESYFKPGRKIFFIPKNVFRATENGMGVTKAVGNYGQTIRINNRANELGMAGVLYQNEGKTRTEETLASSVIRLIMRDAKTVLQTPKLDHKTILDSITRKTVLAIAKEELGWTVEETDISPDDFLNPKEPVLGIFCTGTAAGITPINAVRTGNFNNDTGEINDLGDEVEVYKYDESNPMGAEGSRLLELLLDAKTGNLQKRKLSELNQLNEKRNRGEDVDEDAMIKLNALVAEYDSWLTKV